MANPPYSATVLLIEEGSDGLILTAVHWDEKIGTDPSVLEPPRISQLVASLKTMTPKPTFYTQQVAATRAVAVAKFQGFLNQRYSETPAS